MLMLACLTLVASAQSAPAQMLPRPEIFIREPVNGAIVSGSFSVVFGLRGYGVAPAGINVANTGHFHLVINGQVPAAGTLIPPNDSIYHHFGSGVIETRLTLPRGTHTLRLVLGDFEHKVIGPDLVSAPIKITVK